MRLRNGETVKLTDPHRHKYADAMAEYLDTQDWGDVAGGDVECPTGFYSLFGKRIVFTDDRGFVWCEKYADRRSAELVFDALDNYYSTWSYSEWCASDEEWSEERTVVEIAKADAWLAYVVSTVRDGMEPLSMELWAQHGSPTHWAGAQ